MLTQVRVGAEGLIIHDGFTILFAEADGQIHSGREEGLYVYDTRLLSQWRVYANGDPWDFLDSGPVTHNAARVILTNRKIDTGVRDIPPRTLTLEILRAIDNGVHEDLVLSNHGEETADFNLELALESDFADLFEVRARDVMTRGHIETKWSENGARITTTYSSGDYRRQIILNVRAADYPVNANGKISFAISLRPKIEWRCCLLYDFVIDGKERLDGPDTCFSELGRLPSTVRMREWIDNALRIDSPIPDFNAFFARSVTDIAALRLPIPGTDPLHFIPAAGVPWFAAPFGRDSLICSYQAAIINPDFARGTLDVLGSLQALEHDRFRDAEPGKIVHEIRRGELAHFSLIPHTRYYGTADATPLYLIVLHNSWRTTGDEQLLRKYWPVAERCLEWIDCYGDMDGDGFQEYQTHSAAGYDNQGWKDANDSIVYPDGELVEGPKALCELQGYVFDAWRRSAEMCRALDLDAYADELEEKAQNLFRRFNDVFGVEEEGVYALALDGDKNQVATVASNTGHCLWSGIVPPERAARVVKRLLQSDMSTGWGVRTLSAENPAFNPLHYQNGSVWPHDNSLIALGFRRYGFAEEACQIAYDIAASSRYFMLSRIPELFSGLPRETESFPVKYKGANAPQAWAAGAAFAFLQMFLGYQPDAPNGALYIDPYLPDWLPTLRLEGLRVGMHSADLELWRENDRTCWRVTDGNIPTIRQRPFEDYRLRAG